jgi:preflagellin peptidase FlaK
MDFSQAVDFSSIAVSVFFLGLGSLYDMKTREVGDNVWLAYGPIGLILTICRLLLNPSWLFLAAISMVVSVGISFALFYFGLFGGADAKAIMCLGLTLPLPPASYAPILGYVHPFFPLAVSVMGFICSASVAVWFGVRNILCYLSEGPQMFQGFEHESQVKKAMAALTGYRADIQKLQSTFYLYPLEEVTRNANATKRSFKLVFSAEADRDRMVSEFTEAFSSAGFHGEVWVTPGLPLLLFIFVGLIITLIVGDPVFTSVLRFAARQR